ncbi:MAG: response regulator [Zoogloeaceae bacterium]|jgi:twitching motility two-component system response regulator PilH|nr:response regulator [Zoogloeaceae bacterium]
MSLFDQFLTLFSKPSDVQPLTLDGAEDLLQQPERRVRPRVNPREGTRVLIIDDSQTVVTALKRILRSAGCEAITALDAESGLKLVLSRHPELIFLDIVLPGINGFAALRALRRDERTRGIPIIMMSGNEQATEQFFGARVGADDFMKKPFSRLEVFARIEQLLDEDLILRRRQSPEQPVAAPPPRPAVVAHPSPYEHRQAAALLHQGFGAPERH